MQIIRIANLLLSLVILGVVFAWSRTTFRVPARFSSFASAARPAVVLSGWLIMVLVVGGAAMNVVTGYVDPPGVHFYSPYTNADAFWLGIAVRVAAGLLVGGSLVTMARDGRSKHVEVAAPDA